MENNVTVRLVNVGKQYGNKAVFQGISKVLTPGQCLAITGPNGSGKSTLLKIIAGVIKPSAGEICIMCGQQKLTKEEYLEYIGILSPEIVFYGDMTGIENIVFLSRCRGRECSSAYAQELCATVGLSRNDSKLLNTYSTGMKQRLKFALILAVRPALWLLDEPSSNLDAEGKKVVKDAIHMALEDMATVIIASNECWETEYASEKIVLSECCTDGIHQRSTM